ncbi:hypothetical protein L228DRAFT_247377 [Xylona heveae TC161]|uniref:Uncharacterized protein n=1 Tax=Xylona heveae (strain CBS 132557 / TC161) TaxID=1328760 RepID=A0A165H3Y7_XYLHT|nr:hypothetical protein L228DRAFT_247377 [Xylona heveae TC161]KZF22953.1 hypothetical protein L228DRAFT_247377 [Xylona heveae TC161]
MTTTAEAEAEAEEAEETAATAATSLAIPCSLSVSSLRLIRGFQKLGTFSIPDVEPDAKIKTKPPKIVDDAEGLHAYLTTLISTHPNPTRPTKHPTSHPTQDPTRHITKHTKNTKATTNDSSDEQEPWHPASTTAEDYIVSSILQNLHHLSSGRGSSSSTGSLSIQIQLFSISVLGTAPDALFNHSDVGGTTTTNTATSSGSSGGSQVLVWRWAKPESAYDRKSGFWETKIDDAIDDGEWSGGRELYLLVQSVSRERREELKHGRVVIQLEY